MPETAAPRSPADHGLAGLGTIMQLAGTLALVLVGASGILAVVAIMAFNHEQRLHADGTLTIWALLVAVTGIARSWAHRAAGARLLADPAGTPFVAVRRYLVIAAIQTVVWIAFAAIAVDEAARAIAPAVIALVAWPAALAVVISLPRFRAMEHGVPMDPDRGLEGVGILMTILGATGVVFAGVAVYVWVQLPDEILARLYGTLGVVVLLLLVGRSVLHAIAGWRGLAERDLDRVVAAAIRYGNVGVLTALAAGIVAVLFMMSTTADPIGVIGVAAVAGSLLVWPMIVRRLFADRFAIEPSVDERRIARPESPDRGLTWLGWLLLGLGLAAASQALPAALDSRVASRYGVETPLGSLLALPQATPRSAWWLVGVAGLQIWAGVELVAMTARFRIAALAYGAVGTAVAVYVYAPAIAAVRGLATEEMFEGGPAAFVFVMTSAAVIAIALIVPLATLGLVLRVSRSTRA